MNPYNFNVITRYNICLSIYLVCIVVQTFVQILHKLDGLVTIEVYCLWKDGSQTS
jgi:hypothetical protein